MRFQSKNDGFLWAVSGLVFVIYAFVSVLFYVIEGDHTAIYGLGSIWLLLTIFMNWIVPRSTHYTFLEDHLLCQSMGLKKRIYYATFNKLEPANGLYAGWKMSTAWKCLVFATTNTTSCWFLRKTKLLSPNYLNKKKPSLPKQTELVILKSSQC